MIHCAGAEPFAVWPLDASTISPEHRFLVRLAGAAASQIVVEENNVGSQFFANGGRAPASFPARPSAIHLLGDALQLSRALGFGGVPVKIIFVPVLDARDVAAGGHVEKFVRDPAWRARFERWQTAGATVEVQRIFGPAPAVMAINDPRGLELALRYGALLETDAAPNLAEGLTRLWANFAQESFSGSQLRYAPLMVLVWAETRVKLSADAGGAPDLARLPVTARGLIVNLADALIPPFSQSTAMKAFATRHGMAYVAVSKEAGPDDAWRRRDYGKLARDAFDQALPASLADYAVVTIPSALAGPASARRFTFRSAAAVVVNEVALSERGFTATQTALLGKLRETLRAGAGREEPFDVAVRDFLPGLAGGSHAQALQGLFNHLRGGRLATLFDHGREAQAEKLIAEFARLFPAEREAVQALTLSLDRKRVDRVGQLLQRGGREDVIAAEAMAGRIGSPELRAARQREALRARALLRLRGGELATGLIDANAWYAQTQKTDRQLAETVLHAATAGTKFDDQIIGEWLRRLLSVEKNLTPVALAGAGRWLAAAPFPAKLLERAADLGGPRMARAALALVHEAAASERSAWLELALGNPGLARKLAADRALSAGEPAAIEASAREHAALCALEAALPALAALAELDRRVGAAATEEAFAKMRGTPIFADWSRQIRAVAEQGVFGRAEQASLPRGFAKLAWDENSRAILVTRFDPVGPRGKTFFEICHGLDGSRILKLEFTPGENAFRTVPTAATVTAAKRGASLAAQRALAYPAGLHAAIGVLSEAYRLAPAARDLAQLLPMVLGSVPDGVVGHALILDRASGGVVYRRPAVVPAAVEKDAKCNAAQTPFMLPPAGGITELGAPLYAPRSDAKTQKTYVTQDGVVRLGLRSPPPENFSP